MVCLLFDIDIHQNYSLAVLLEIRISKSAQSTCQSLAMSSKTAALAASLYIQCICGACLSRGSRHWSSEICHYALVSLQMTESKLRAKEAQLAWMMQQSEPVIGADCVVAAIN